MSHFLACLIEQREYRDLQHAKAMTLGFEVAEGDRTAYFEPGETVQFELTATKSGYYYCYYQQSDGSIIRLAPSIYSPNHFISRNTSHTVPGGRLWKVKANRSNSVGEIMCVLSGYNQSEQLAISANGKIETLPLATLCQVYCLHQAYAATALECESAVIRIGAPSESPVAEVAAETTHAGRNRCSC